MTCCHFNKLSVELIEGVKNCWYYLSEEEGPVKSWGGKEKIKEALSKNKVVCIGECNGFGVNNNY